jgi:peptide/nickel transport system substrate-binding protein
MSPRRIWTRVGLLAAAAAVAAALVTLPAEAQDSEGTESENVLRIGWGADPQTLNPFVGLNEEEYTIWALTWDLLVGFDPEDLSPTAGIAEEWEVSDDQKTVTFTLADRNWSDGEPITSADVKYSLETLGEEGSLFAGYTSNVTSIETPDDKTVVINTKRPDARIVGGIFVYVIPEHIWGEESIEDLTGSFQPEIPMVGSGPYVVAEFERDRIVRMERNPEWEGEEPPFDEIQFIKYGNEDAVERALQLGEIDADLEVQPATFERLGEQPDIETQRGASPSYTELAFNLCSEENCPDAEFNPAVQDKTVRQAIAYSLDLERITEISSLGTSFPGTGVLPSYYRSFYEEPEQLYPTDVELANQMLDEAGWQDNGDEPRTKGDQELSFDLYVRSESQSDIQAAKLVAEMAAEIGVEFNVEVVSTGKLTELTVQKVDGVPAPAFDTFIWGWGGDPYDPSFLLSLFTTDEIGLSSDSFYSNPEYDRLYAEQAGEFDTEARKEIIQEMVAITQEDLPYIVLTEDPNLQAYRTDAISTDGPVCPADDTGDLMCEQVTYAGLFGLEAGSGASSDDDGGGGGAVIAIVAAVVVIGGGLLFLRSRRRREAEPLELGE